MANKKGTFIWAYETAKSGLRVAWVNNIGDLYLTEWDSDYEKLHWSEDMGSDFKLVTLNRNTKKGWEIYEGEIKEVHKANLGCATTKEIMDELFTRIEIQAPELLNYRTIDRK